ncbi:MAG: GNAT family N-acetyltransferase [Verrucomicrobia bacterium]|nr:GNAT family N-acetyltransferase [Verrucomicrobiota bacterium]
MIRTTSPVVALDRHQLPQALATLVKAFAFDPMATYFFPNAPQRGIGLAHIFQMALRHGLRGGAVDAVHDGGGVAIWLRSERATMSLPRMIRMGLLAAALRVGYAATRRIMRFLQWMEEQRLQSVASRHWYLLNLAVRPELQGQGLGSILLRSGLDRAQLQGVPCFLETTNPRNVPFYEKHGFRVIHEGHPPSGGPQVWSFLKTE